MELFFAVVREGLLLCHKNVRVESRSRNYVWNFDSVSGSIAATGLASKKNKIPPYSQTGCGGDFPEVPQLSPFFDHDKSVTSYRGG